MVGAISRLGTGSLGVDASFRRRRDGEVVDFNKNHRHCEACSDEAIPCRIRAAQGLLRFRGNAGGNVRITNAPE
jgi:hypothetical protein